MKKLARVSSKGRITVPHEVRRALGVGPGDQLLFEEDGTGFRLKSMRSKGPFERYRGIGNPGMPPGRKGITRTLRKLRGL